MLPHDELYHYGVKGMKWGVRKPEETAKPKRAKAEEQYNKEFSRVQKQLKSSGLNEKTLKGKYGTDDNFLDFVKDHKKEIAIGAGVLAAGAYLGYQVYRWNNDPFVMDLRYGQTLRKEILETYGSPDFDGLAMHWEQGIDLPAGSIIRRVSSVAETQIRPSGFYGSFLDGDIESYKACLPGYWMQWKCGSPAGGGFVNSYRALTGVRAPSGSETYSMFKELFKSNEKFRNSLLSNDPMNGMMYAMNKQMFDAEETQKSMFKAFMTSLVDPDRESSKVFFNQLNSKGYNALIDFNDAGNLAKAPLRIINAKDFEIVGSERFEFKDILKAVEDWTPELLHTEGGAMLLHDELYHYGVLGMKWGVRKDVYDRRSKIHARRAENLSRQARAYQDLSGGFDPAYLKKAKEANYYAEVQRRKAQKYSDKASGKTPQKKTFGEWFDDPHNRMRVQKAVGRTVQVAAVATYARMVVKLLYPGTTSLVESKMKGIVTTPYRKIKDQVDIRDFNRALENIDTVEDFMKAK